MNLIYQLINSLTDMKSIEPVLPLWGYVIMVIIVWAIVLFVVSQLIPAKFIVAVGICAGFFISMRYMYLRMRVSHLEK